ncbi:MAG: quinolinate synthase NadA [Candidatus Thermoplasmatota archaeon]|nr:quinolinate synthase NadA [Candidatus Thermoplasmatota archaeon]
MPELSEKQQHIRQLAKEKDVVILAHNYQPPEVQDIADIIGDSLALSRQARDASQSTILFCGVWFMAESAAILSPNKTVLIPEPGAICPMARMVDAETVRMLRSRYPEAVFVAYVNTTADVKAEVDICCTSANAVKVVKSIPQKQVVMVPDCNLALYTRRLVPEKEIILPAGYCPTHQAGITPEAIRELKEKHPGAEVMVHPECIPEVIDLADGAYSTEGMITRARESPSMEFIVGTEKEHAYRLKTLLPDKTFHSIPSAICPNMKKINLDKVLTSLEKGVHVVDVPEDIRKRALVPLERMLEAGR